MSLFEKRILITNDDGINAPGLLFLVKSLRKLVNDIYIVAPEQQSSGVGKAVTFERPLRVTRITSFPVANVTAYTISGTPADAVIFGLGSLNKKFDLTISGINAGENTSIHSMLTSGTCAGAFESAFFRIPAFAFSLTTHSSEFFVHEQNKDFAAAAELSCKFVRHFLENGFPKEVSFFNVNYPSGVTEKTPIRETSRLAFLKYRNYAFEKSDPRGVPYYWSWGDLHTSFDDGSDADIVLKRKEVSV
ncbi:MAG: 5'/3'-nucleotidase SurE, partial [Candidatus Hodarchaeota archaeon]